MTPIVLLSTFLTLGCGRLDTPTTAGARNLVYFAPEHHRIAESSFLTHDQLAGAQLTYTWRELEPERDRYELEPLRERLAFLQRHGKRLFVQLQDVSFSERILVPDYLRTDVAFRGGVARKYEGDDESHARFDGWVARRWDPAVRARFINLIETLGAEFDGRIEGLVLPETAMGFENPEAPPCGFHVRALRRRDPGDHDCRPSGVSTLLRNPLCQLHAWGVAACERQGISESGSCACRQYRRGGRRA